MKIKIHDQNDFEFKLYLIILYPVLFFILRYTLRNADDILWLFINYYYILPSIIGMHLSVVILPSNYIYEDRIESKNILGITNVVYFKDIIRIKEIECKNCYYYVFDDGRKDDEYDKIYNRPIYNLRLCKTKQLENFILNDLKIPIVKCEPSKKQKLKQMTVDNKVMFVQECDKKIKIINKIITITYLLISLYFLFFFYLPNGLFEYATSVRTRYFTFDYGGCFISYYVTKSIKFIFEIFEEYSWIYSDKIELRTNIVIKNVVYFKDVKQIKEVKLITGKSAYVFDDGRKDGLFNNYKLTGINKFKYNLRIKKTDELEQFILTNLCDKLVCNEGISSNGLG